MVATRETYLQGLTERITGDDALGRIRKLQNALVDRHANFQAAAAANEAAMAALNEIYEAATEYAGRNCTWRDFIDGLEGKRSATASMPDGWHCADVSYVTQKGHRKTARIILRGDVNVKVLRWLIACWHSKPGVEGCPFCRATLTIRRNASHLSLDCDCGFHAHVEKTPNLTPEYDL